MNNNKIVFLILHYYTIKETEECIQSIQENIDSQNYEIIVVDNASPNGTGTILKEKYKQNRNIHVIINTQNLGFAKGNNIGFIYAKDKLKANYIIMMNNDTKIIQSNFISLVEAEYAKSEFGVLGPEIILKGNIINPIYEKLPTIKEITKRLRKYKIEYSLTYIYIYELYAIMKQRAKKLLKRDVKIIKQDINKRLKNVILHGCCLIFSPKYIELFNGLDDRTFLYCEEELLFIRLMKNNMKSIYNPNIKIYHAEDAATNAITKTKRNKAIFTYKNLIKSNKILLKELKGYYTENK